MKTFLTPFFICSLAVAVPLTEPNATAPHISHLQRSWRPHRHPLHTADLAYPYGSSYFYTNITIGTQPFTVVLDAGSANVFVVATDYSCTLTPAEGGPCNFLSTFNIDDSFTPISDENLFATYGAGIVNGTAGYDSVTLAGVTVPKEQIGLVDSASMRADGEFSGILGLAFPALTAFFNGTTFTATSEQVETSSIINNIFNVDNLTAPLFSLALSRDASNTSYGGIFALGGIPDKCLSQINASNTFFSAPFEIEPPAPPKEFQHYAINISSISYSNSTSSNSTTIIRRYVVDSDAPVCTFPAPLAASINAMFSPPAILNKTLGTHLVDCNAAAPTVVINIGGGSFTISPTDLIVPTFIGANATDGTVCMSGIQPASAGSLGQIIVGEPFLKNVLAVFDWGKSEMRFAGREYYES